ncbi:MAG TPA: hypothetical protein VKR58_13540 [Aquella sp.]|nr:hypothetical protein [Aquella sp.]
MNYLKIIICTITLSLVTSLSIANAQDNSTPATALSSSAQEVLKWLNDPKNANDNLNNKQTQDGVEQVMSIMKSLEDQNIKGNDKKIEYVNSLNVSTDMKEWAISYINQNINYSDNEKVSYGIYRLKKCDGSHKVNDCQVDFRPNQGTCVEERSNICCQ